MDRIAIVGVLFLLFVTMKIVKCRERRSNKRKRISQKKMFTHRATRKNIESLYHEAKVIHYWTNWRHLRRFLGSQMIHRFGFLLIPKTSDRCLIFDLATNIQTHVPSFLVTGWNIFEYREMLVIISRVRRKEREMSLRYRRLFFSII